MVRLDRPHDNCQTLAECNRAALLDYRSGTLQFNSIVAFPSSCNKLAVRQGSDGRFYTLSNPVTKAPVANYGTKSCGQRNTAVLAVSSDLSTWTTCATVLYDDTVRGSTNARRKSHAFKAIWWGRGHGLPGLQRGRQLPLHGPAVH